MAKLERARETHTGRPMRHRLWDDGDIEQEVRDIALRDARRAVEKFADQMKKFRPSAQRRAIKRKNA